MEARRLFRGSRELHLSPKEFDLLKLLIEARPRALSKAEILERVWPGVFVSDASLARTINQIRQRVGDPARRPRIVRTVHAYGYAFAAEVADEPPRAAEPVARRRGACWLLLGRRRFPLADGEHIVGRDANVEVWLDSPKVSRQHARLVAAAGAATIEDLGSKNGTFVRGSRVEQAVVLEPGDEIQIGPFVLVFRSVSESRSTETAL